MRSSSCRLGPWCRRSCGGCRRGLGRATTRATLSSVRMARRMRRSLAGATGSIDSRRCYRAARRRRMRGRGAARRASPTFASPTPTACPFPFARAMREQFNLCSVVTASRGPAAARPRRALDARRQRLVRRERRRLRPLQGLDGAGVGARRGSRPGARARCIRSSPRTSRCCSTISGLDEVSFHMSGTEAVMAAVRLARFNTRPQADRVLRRRVSRLVGRRAAGPRQRADHRRLPDAQGLHPASLARHPPRASEIAAVLVNPVQSFHPNAPPPNDAVLLTSGMRQDATKPTERLRRVAPRAPRASARRPTSR